MHQPNYEENESIILISHDLLGTSQKMSKSVQVRKAFSTAWKRNTIESLIYFPAHT